MNNKDLQEEIKEIVKRNIKYDYVEPTNRAIEELTSLFQTLKQTYAEEAVVGFYEIVKRIVKAQTVVPTHLGAISNKKMEAEEMLGRNILGAIQNRLNEYLETYKQTLGDKE